MLCLLYVPYMCAESLEMSEAISDSSQQCGVCSAKLYKQSVCFWDKTTIFN